MDSRFYSPLRYPGGKTSIFPFVAKVFYENDLVGASYAEPYAGGAGLALKLLFAEYVEKIYINDLDKAIFAFWQTVTTNSRAFCDWISNVEISVENWHFYKSVQSNPNEHDEFTLAKSTFFLNRTNVSGVIKGGIIGGYDQKGVYKIDARFKKDALIEKIERISCFKHRIRVSNLDGLEFIKRMDRKKEEIFIYLDPPYFQKGADLYLNFYQKEDHRKLSNAVHRIKKKWMVSYDNHDFILNLYGEKAKITYKLSQGASNRIGDEILIFADNLLLRDAYEALTRPASLYI